MKKYIMVWLAMAAMVCSLSACGTAVDDKKEDTVQNADVSKDAEEGEGTAPAEDGAEPEETADSQNSSAGPQIDIITNHCDDSEEAEYIYGYYQSVTVMDDTFPELRDAVHNWFRDYEEQYEEDVQKFLPDAKQQAEDMGDNFYGYSLENSVKTGRVDAAVTSFSILESSYLGGAHGDSYLYGITFDTKTGKELTFEDLGDIRDEIKPYIDSYIEQKRTEGYEFGTYETGISEKLDNPVWYLDGLGLNFVFNNYEIASYAEGMTVVNIPYSEMEHFNPSYKMNGKTMFAELKQYEAVSVDIDDDGTLDTVKLAGEYDVNGEIVPEVVVNDLSLRLDTCSYMKDSYLVKDEEGRMFVLVSCDMMSDDFSTYLIEITGGVPKKEGMEEGTVIGMMNGSFLMQTYVYVLGTYTGKRTYTISDGAICPVEERYTFAGNQAPNRIGPVLKQEITVLAEENGQMAERTLSEGTAVYPVNTDGESVVGFELEDGTYCELSFERDNGTIYIDGISEYDLFDKLPYVGCLLFHNDLAFGFIVTEQA